MLTMRRMKLGVSAGLLLTVVGISGPGRPADSHPECPHSWDSKSFPEGRKHGFPVNGRLSVPGIITSVPEFHDCQRLIKKDGSGGLRYDSLAAVFARAHLDSAVDSTGGLEAGLAVGEVYAENLYDPLGIQPGFNCLVLKLTATGYSAWMVPVATNESRCFGTVSLSGPLPPRLLAVDQVAMGQGEQLGAGDIPPVARWDWNRADSTHYIGIRCRRAWCEVHARGASGSFVSSIHYPMVGGLTPMQARVRRVKGWYDQQYLAEFDPSGKPMPSDNMATIFPVPGLDTMTVDFFAAKRWVPVAHASLPKFSIGYAKKFSYGVAPAPPDMAEKNELAFCMGSAAKCGIRAGASLCTDRVFGRIVSSGMPVTAFTGGVKSKKYFCVHVRPFPAGFKIPGVVRWRWRATDETIWARCASGCCEVDENQVISGPI